MKDTHLACHFISLLMRIKKPSNLNTSYYPFYDIKSHSNGGWFTVSNATFTYLFWNFIRNPCVQATPFITQLHFGSLRMHTVLKMQKLRLSTIIIYSLRRYSNLRHLIFTLQTNATNCINLLFPVWFKMQNHRVMRFFYNNFTFVFLKILSSP